MLTKTILAAYVLTMMNTWASPKEQVKFGESLEEAETRYSSIADDVAEVVLDEAPIFSESNGGRVKTAALMTSLGFNETRFWKYVDAGLCNDREWRRSIEGKRIITSYGHCDGGLAWSMWQVHIYGKGFNVNGDLIDGPKMIADRKAAIRIALRIARQSMKVGNLCAYTGETNADGSCTERHPKADHRLDFATRYFVKHPIVSE